MTAVYRTEPQTITYLSPAEFKFLIHRDPELGYGLRQASQTDQDNRTLFEQRLEVTSRSVYRWLRWRFDDIDAATLDDCLQAGLVGLWLDYQDDPRTLDAEDQGRWNKRAKHHAHKAMYRKYMWHSRYRRSKRGLVWRTVSMTFTDLEDDDQQGLLLELIGDDCCAIEQIESALDLELAIEGALKQLSPNDRDAALTLLHLRLQGLTRWEIGDRTGLAYGRIQRIETRFKKLLCEAAGKLYAPNGSQLRGRATDGEKARILQLHVEGWTYAQIAARTGRSGSYIHKLVNGVKQPPAEERTRLQAMRESGLSNAQIGKMIDRSATYVCNALQ
jgi:DNA-directed RNA polymerase specialized sigma24 family protein